MNARLKPWLAMCAGIATAFSMAACNRAGDTETAGQKLDRNIAEAKQESREARQATEEKTAEMKESTKDAVDKAGTMFDDSAITASVKAKLAADAQLSALDISVNTDHGKVSLTGTAPTDAARVRATTLAGTVDGVRSVDNNLKLASDKS